MRLEEVPRKKRLLHFDETGKKHEGLKFLFRFRTFLLFQDLEQTNGGALFVGATVSSMGTLSTLQKRIIQNIQEK